MTRRQNSLSTFGLLVVAALSALGMWLFFARVLVAYQITDAKMHGTPRGNLSDLYPRWVGTRELLLHGRDPYSEEVTRQIQAGHYGRPLDPTRPEDPKDKQGFAYPAYVVFYLAPFMHLPFETVRLAFLYFLLAATIATVPLWVKLLSWRLGLAQQASLILFVLGSVGVVQALKLQQISLFVAALIAIAVGLLVSGHAVAAGIVLAFATVKPQLVFLLLIWLVIWTLADWRARYPWALSFFLTMAVLAGAAEWYLPHWIPRFWHALAEYQRYTRASSVSSSFLPTPLARTLEALVTGIGLLICWKNRKHSAETQQFVNITSLVLAITILIIPTLAPYNQVLLMPAAFLLVRDRKAIWASGSPACVLLITAAGVCLWPAAAAACLAGLSLVWPAQRVQQFWAAPFWTSLFLPLSLAIPTLVHAYRAAFTPSKSRMSA